MKVRNVGILVFEGVEVLDFAGPYEVFSRTRVEPGIESRRDDASAPFHVFTVAAETAPLRATGGLQLIPDYRFGEAPPIDVLVVPGGFGTRALLHDGTTTDWLRATAASAERVTSVCTGSLLLASAGILGGRRATTHWGALDTLAGLDESVSVDRDARVVFDGVVTSAGVASGIDMAFDVVELLLGRTVADDTARYIEFVRHRSVLPEA